MTTGSNSYSPQNTTILTQMSFYATGCVRHNKTDVIIKFTKTARGWSSKVIEGSAHGMGNDYVSNEEIHELIKWLLIDFVGKPNITDDLGEAKEILEAREHARAQRKRARSA